MKLFLSFFEPAALSHALFVCFGLSRLDLRLIAGKGDDHDCNSKDCKKADQRQKWEGREQEKRALGLGSELFAMGPPEVHVASERAGIVFGSGPGCSRRRIRDARLLFHGALGARPNMRMQ